jgi:hypothetical protein
MFSYKHTSRKISEIRVIFFRLAFCFAKVPCVLCRKSSRQLLADIHVADYCEVYPVYSRLLGAVEDGGLLEDNSSEVAS